MFSYIFQIEIPEKYGFPNKIKSRKNVAPQKFLWRNLSHETHPWTPPSQIENLTEIDKLGISVSS